jgi:hypothetical protein
MLKKRHFKKKYLKKTSKVQFKFRKIMFKNIFYSALFLIYIPYEVGTNNPK